jgi:hypothetical protein
MCRGAAENSRPQPLRKPGRLPQGRLSKEGRGRGLLDGGNLQADPRRRITTARDHTPEGLDLNSIERSSPPSLPASSVGVRIGHRFDAAKR